MMRVLMVVVVAVVAGCAAESPAESTSSSSSDLRTAPSCRALGCAFAPWGWCGADETRCSWGGGVSSDASAAACERRALSTCAEIGYAIPECWITMAATCSEDDERAAYLHCIASDGLQPGASCQLQWR